MNLYWLRNLIVRVISLVLSLTTGEHRYYIGEKKAPLLTIVIGGNHEASNYLWEL
jgi:hypothetical protein